VRARDRSQTTGTSRLWRLACW